MSDKKHTPALVETIWEGSWGSITPSPHAAETVRFCRVQDGVEVEIISYPYRSLGCWTWANSEPEKVAIETGIGDTILVVGKGLKRLAEALDQGQLQLVREQGEDQETGNILVYSIQVKAAKPQ